MWAAARASAAGMRAGRPSASASAPVLLASTSPATSTSPSPMSASAQWASGARSPLAPSEPYSGTTGVMPAFRSAAIVSATIGRVPDHPIASVRARSTIIARTTSRSIGGPIPAAWERTSAFCSSARRSGGIRTRASEPKPVETP